MKLEHWHILLESRRRIRLTLEEVLPVEPPPPGQPPGRPNARIGLEAIELLRQRLLEALADLKAALGADLDETQVSATLLPYTILVDEMVLRRLAESEQAQWRLLQRQLFGIDDGGERFYELADSSLRRPDVAPMVFEVLHFCLTAGFVGRHIGNTARLRHYKEQLAARIPRPEATARPAPAPAPVEPEVHAFPVLYYAITALIVVALPVVLWWLSN